MLRDSPFTTFARSTFGGAVLVVAAMAAALLLLLIWVSRPGRPDRRMATAAAVCAPSLIILLNVILGRLGVWQSALYTLPPVTLVSTALLFLAVVTVVMLLMLSGHRRAAAHSRRTALIYILLLVTMVAVLVVLADTVALTQHYLAFAHGYTIWIDVVVGVLTLASPVVVFELLQRRRSSDTSKASC